MEYIYRNLTNALLESIKTRPLTYLNGGRQVGKSTLCAQLSNDIKVNQITFDSPLILSSAKSDPANFVDNLPKDTLNIIDEVQFAPEIFPYLKMKIDENRLAGQNKSLYLLTGSANLMALPTLSDALVGRMSILTLYPFSASEYYNTNIDLIDKLFNEDLSIQSYEDYDILDAICNSTYPEIAKKAADAMENEGIRVRDCLCIINEGGWTVLQVFCAPMKKKISAAELAAAVSDFTGIDFAPPVVGPSDSGQILLLFCEKPPCAVRAAVSQITGDGQSVCGDAYDFFNDGRGHYMMILSDGMGTGSRAAVDGAMTTNLASKLIRAGFSFECVVKTVNSALMVKSKDESLSTLDIVSIDLFNSDATFYKAGAAASLLCRRGKTIRIERASLPLGILRDVEFERVTGKIGDGDLIIMMSDGAMVIPPDKLRQTLSDCADQPVQEIASAITALAKEESPTGKADDITVLAAVVHKRA